MYHREFEPSQQLKGTIKCFWYNQRDFGDKPTQFEVQPDGYAEIIFHFGEGCSIEHNGKLKLLPSPFMIGLLDKPLYFNSQNNLQIIAIRCYPWSVFDLLGLSSGKDNIHLLKHPIAKLQEQLESSINDDNVEGAVKVLENYCLDMRSQVATDSLLAKAGIAMEKANGTLPVKDVAVAAHATVRTLERKFKKSAGHSVKDVSGLMRFEQVRNRLWTEPDATLTALAYEFGYTDQSHLSREFKRYSGTTPAAFARKAKKDRQELGRDFVAFVQS